MTADVILLISMCPNVYRQLPTLYKGSPTELASVVFLTCVSLDMSIQMATAPEQCTAKGTREIPLIGM